MNVQVDARFLVAVKEGAEARRKSQQESIKNPPPGSFRVAIVGGDRVIVQCIPVAA